MMPSLDSHCRKVVTQNPNMCVPWFLMCSILYYREDKSAISDETFDWLCKHAAERWRTIKHRHKQFIRRADLETGSGYALKWRSLPMIIYSSAGLLYGRLEKEQPEEISIKEEPCHCDYYSRC